MKHPERQPKAMAVKTASTEAERRKDQLRRNQERIEAYQQRRIAHCRANEPTERTKLFKLHPVGNDMGPEAGETTALSREPRHSNSKAHYIL